MTTPTEPAEPTYRCIPLSQSAAAQNWWVQAAEEDIIRTLASARDLARDLESPIELLDSVGAARGHIEADGNYRMV